jgi:hypothetical protein
MMGQVPCVEAEAKWLSRFSRRAPGRCAIADDEAGVGLLDGPRRRESGGAYSFLLLS